MIHHFVQFALRQRFLILVLVVLVVVAGALSFQRMPVDAYPDLSPPMVEVITQWPGHAAEEIERLVTLPIEVEMNGVPQMQVLAAIHQENGASFIYRENNSRYIGVQFSIEGRDLARAVNEAQDAVRRNVRMPQGYTLSWGGEYSEYVAARQQLLIIGPLAILIIFMILFAPYGNFKFPVSVVSGW